MADDGASSRATTSAEVSSYEASELRLQDSSKAMVDAYHKMMASADRLIASIDSILILEISGRSPTDNFTAEESIDPIQVEKITCSGNQDVQAEAAITEANQEIDAFLKSGVDSIEGTTQPPSIDEGKLQNRQAGTDISSTKFVDDGRAITFIKGQPTTCDEAHLAKKLGAMSNNNMPFEIEGMGDPTIAWGINVDSKHPKILKEFKAELDVGASSQELVRDLKEHAKVIRNPLVVAESKELDILLEILLDSIEFKMARYVISSRDLLETANSYQVYVELLVKGKCATIECVDISHSLTKAKTAYKVFEEMSRSVGTTIFDLGGSLHVLAGEMGKGRVIDMVSTDQFSKNLVMGALLTLHLFKDRLKSMPFDRGRATAISIGLGGPSVISHIGSRLN